MFNQEILQQLSTEEISKLYKEGKLSYLKDIKLTSKHMYEICGNILESMIRSGFLHTEPL
jgi:hypothetical protein